MRPAPAREGAEELHQQRQSATRSGDSCGSERHVRTLEHSFGGIATRKPKQNAQHDVNVNHWSDRALDDFHAQRAEERESPLVLRWSIPVSLFFASNSCCTVIEIWVGHGTLVEMVLAIWLL